MGKKITKTDVVNFIAVAAGVVAFASCIYYANKMSKESRKENNQRATVVSREKLLGDEKCDTIRLELDTNNDPKTIEGYVTIDPEGAFEDDPMLEKTLPDGTTRTIWEWKKLGWFHKNKIGPNY